MAARRLVALLLIAATACTVESSVGSGSGGSSGGTSSGGSSSGGASSGASSGGSSSGGSSSGGTSSGGASSGGSSSGASSSSGGSSGGGSTCAPTVAVFDALVWRPVLAFKCAICHAATGVAATTRLVFDTGAAAGAAEKNLAAAAGMALASEEGQALILRKSTGTQHTGGTVIQPGDADYQRLSDFVGRVRGDAAACEASRTPACASGDPGPRVVRRLSRNEYDATIRDVLGVTAAYASTLVPDVTVHGFDNNAGALVVTPLLAEQLRTAGEEIGQAYAARTASACTGEGATCAREFLQGTGARLLRRPLTDGEVTRWLDVYRAGAANPSAGTAAHASGLATLVAGLLQSPAFLYRAELGTKDAATGRYVLDSYEIASELSYMLWAAPPDDLLWEAAAADGLRTPAGIAAQASRLMASPRARTSVERFTRQWLTSDQIAIAKKDQTAYPELTDAIRTGMAEELGRVAAAYTLEGGTLEDLFTAKDTWVDAKLAGFYGIPAPATPDASGFGKVPGRGGLLLSGAVLTVHGQPNSSSPISRGKLVREQILCQVLPTPPSGVVAQPPAMDSTMTTRERYRAHSELAACYSCHVLVDPIGFGFEHYDGIGRYRENENGKPVDDRGEILATAASNATFTGPAELSTLLGKSSEVQACFALQWLRWAYGLSEGTRTACLVEDVRAQFEAKGFVIKDLLLALTQSSHFRTRVVEAAIDPGSSSGGTSSGGTSSGGSSSGGSSSGGSSSGGSSSGGTSSGGSSSGGASSGGSSGGSPSDSPGVTAAVTKTNTWTGGYCATLKVTNTGSQAVTWRVTVPVEGTIYDHWNCDLAPNGTQVTFTGASFNSSLAAGASAEVGFCARL